jgi:hypothetical protein
MTTCDQCQNWKRDTGRCQEYGERTHPMSTCGRAIATAPAWHPCPAHRALGYLSTVARLQAADQAARQGDTTAAILLSGEETKKGGS